MGLKERTFLKTYAVFFLPLLILFSSSVLIFYLKVDFAIFLIGAGSALLLGLFLNMLFLEKLTSPFALIRQKAGEILEKEAAPKAGDSKVKDEQGELLLILDRIKQEKAESKEKIEGLNQRVLDAVGLKVEEFQGVYLLSEDLLSIPQMVSTPHKVIEIVKKLFAPEFVTFYSYQEPDGFILSASLGLKEQEKEQAKVMVTPGAKDPLYPLVYSHNPVKIQNPSDNFMIKERLPVEEIKEYYSIPVMGKDKLKGIIETGWEKEISGKEEKLLVYLGKQVGILMENIAIHQKALQDKEEAKATLSGAGIAIVKLDKECKIRFFNQLAQEITGISEKTALGKFCYEVFQGKTREGTTVCSVNNCYLLKGEPLLEYELFFEKLGGEARILKFIPALLEDGRVLSFYDVSGNIELEKIYQEFFSRSYEEILGTLSALRESITYSLKSQTLPDTTELVSGLSHARNTIENQTLWLDKLMQVARLKGKSLCSLPPAVLSGKGHRESCFDL